MSGHQDAICNKLVEVAKAGSTIVYEDLGDLIGVDVRTREGNEYLSDILGRISRDQHQLGKPLLSAVAVHKTDDQIAGKGFFTNAKSLGVYSGSGSHDNEVWFKGELRRVHEEWKPSRNRQDEIVNTLEAAHYQITRRERLPDGYGTQITLANGATVSSYDTGKFNVGGKSDVREEVERVLVPLK